MKKSINCLRCNLEFFKFEIRIQHGRKPPGTTFQLHLTECDFAIQTRNFTSQKYRNLRYRLKLKIKISIIPHSNRLDEYINISENQGTLIFAVTRLRWLLEKRRDMRCKVHSVVLPFIFAPGRIDLLNRFFSSFSSMFDRSCSVLSILYRFLIETQSVNHRTKVRRNRAMFPTVVFATLPVVDR